MKPPKDLEEAREVGLEADSEEGDIEVDSQAYVKNSIKKVIWPETSLTQDDHDVLTAGTMAMQQNTAWN